MNAGGQGTASPRAAPAPLGPPALPTGPLREPSSSDQCGLRSPPGLPRGGAPRAAELWLTCGQMSP